MCPTSIAKTSIPINGLNNLADRDTIKQWFIVQGESGDFVLADWLVYREDNG